jgi:peptidoglycan/xylan/chitin deacetylase (PgdA/CDA1 family)
VKRVFSREVRAGEATRREKQEASLKSGIPGTIANKMSIGKKQVKAILGKTFLSSPGIFRKFKTARLILMYHRVAGKLPAGIHDSALYVTSQTFEMHIREISKYFDIVPLGECLNFEPRTRGLCAITFDDGWSDNYTFAFPVMKQYKVPATVFIPFVTVNAEQDFWFENLTALAAEAGKEGRLDDFIRYFGIRAAGWRRRGGSEEALAGLVGELKKMPASRLDAMVHEAFDALGIRPGRVRHTMTWEQIREMGGHGITFGSHGLRHYILSHVDSPAKREEIVGSWNALLKTDVAVTPFFSYPNGDWDDECLSLVTEAGYRGAVTTQAGINLPSTNPYLLKRIALHEDISNTPALFWFRMLQAAVAWKNT